MITRISDVMCEVYINGKKSYYTVKELKAAMTALEDSPLFPEIRQEVEQCDEKK